MKPRSNLASEKRNNFLPMPCMKGSRRTPKSKYHQWRRKLKANSILKQGDGWRVVTLLGNGLAKKGPPNWQPLIDGKTRRF